MSRISFCQACSNEKHGVKTRKHIEHTCGNQGFVDKHITTVKVLKSIVKEIKEINGWGSHYMLPIGIIERKIEELKD